MATLVIFSEDKKILLQIFELESFGFLIKYQALKECPTIKFLWEFSKLFELDSFNSFIKKIPHNQISSGIFGKIPAVQLDIISTISLATRKCICSFCALLSVMMWVAFAQ